MFIPQLGFTWLISKPSTSWASSAILPILACKSSRLSSYWCLNPALSNVISQAKRSLAKLFCLFSYIFWRLVFMMLPSVACPIPVLKFLKLRVRSLRDLYTPGAYLLLTASSKLSTPTLRYSSCWECISLIVSLAASAAFTLLWWLCLRNCCGRAERILLFNKAALFIDNNSKLVLLMVRGIPRA
jgi:hypothetical protein